MFSRKLEALGYKNRLCFNPSNNEDLRDLVIWLEGFKIRQYKEEDRASLNESLPKWMDAYAAYLKDAECPFEVDETTECVDWLLGYAIRVEYADDAQKFNANSAENVTLRIHRTDEHALDKLQYDGPEFEKRVNDLAKLFNIRPHPTDSKVTFRAIAKFAQMYLSPSDVTAKDGKQIDLSEVNLGFDLKDPAANDAAKVLRLLFLHDLRDLQTSINQAIVAVQKITADPKTDTKLGQVGRKG